MTVLLKKIGGLFAFTAADIVGHNSTEAVARTGNVEAAIAMGSSVEHHGFTGRKYRGRTPHNPSPKGTAAGRLTRRRGGQRHDRSDGD